MSSYHFVYKSIRLICNDEMLWRACHRGKYTKVYKYVSLEEYIGGQVFAGTRKFIAYANIHHNSLRTSGVKLVRPI